MTGTIVTALVLDVVALSVVMMAQLLAGRGLRPVAAGTKPGSARRANASLDRLALMLSLLAGVLILVWLWLG